MTKLISYVYVIFMKIAVQLFIWDNPVGLHMQRYTDLQNLLCCDLVLTFNP